jgi:hypothetical protein
MTERVQTALLNIQLTKHWTEFSFHEQIRIPGSSVARGENEACQRLMAIPGIGPVTATAVIAAIGNGGAFHKGGSSPPGWG